MGIDGPTFVPKSGYVLLIWVEVCLKKLAFSYFFLLKILGAGFFRENVGSFKEEIHLCPCFWLFWPLNFHNFSQISFEKSFFHLKRHLRLP